MCTISSGFTESAASIYFRFPPSAMMVQCVLCIACNSTLNGKTSVRFIDKTPNAPRILGCDWENKRILNHNYGLITFIACIPVDGNKIEHQGIETDIVGKHKQFCVFCHLWLLYGPTVWLEIVWCYPCRSNSTANTSCGTSFTLTRILFYCCSIEQNKHIRLQTKSNLVI